MAHDLHTRERDLLASLTELESEASRHRIAIQVLDARILSAKLELNGVREDILDEFLSEYLSSRLIAYEIKVSENSEILLNLTPVNGGELEFDKIKNTMNWHDMSNVPLFYVLSYLEKGIPWSTDSVLQYDINNDVEYYPSEENIEA